MSKLENLMFNNSDDIPDAWIIKKIKEKERRQEKERRVWINIDNTPPDDGEGSKEKPNRGVEIITYDEPSESKRGISIVAYIV